MLVSPEVTNFYFTTKATKLLGNKLQECVAAKLYASSDSFITYAPLSLLGRTGLETLVQNRQTHLR